MRKMLAFLVGMITGTFGWWVGARAGTVTAVVLSAVATAAGMYYANKWARDNMP